MKVCMCTDLEPNSLGQTLSFSSPSILQTEFLLGVISAQNKGF